MYQFASRISALESHLHPKKGACAVNTVIAEQTSLERSKVRYTAGQSVSK